MAPRTNWLSLLAPNASFFNGGNYIKHSATIDYLQIELKISDKIVLVYCVKNIELNIVYDLYVLLCTHTKILVQIKIPIEYININL